jgi:acyl-CoA thioesterase YciA
MPNTKDELPKDEQPAIRIFAMPTDINASGDIFGGWLMSQVDIAGSIAAYRRAKGRIVTVAVNEFTFLKPVYVGDLVSIYSEVIKVGSTSLQVSVTAYTERERGSSICHKVSEALLTYVAIDENRKPRPVDQ